MRGQGREIARFSANGKTFFFNEMESKKGDPYLAINALYGQGRQERIVLFESHWPQFKRLINRVLDELMRVETDTPTQEEPLVIPCTYCKKDSSPGMTTCAACREVFKSTGHWPRK